MRPPVVSGSGCRNREGVSRIDPVIFLALPELEILDLAGPMQAFAEANAARLRYAIRTVSTRDTITTHQGLTLANLEPLPDVDSRALVVVPAMPYRPTQRLAPHALRCLRPP